MFTFILKTIGIALVAWVIIAGVNGSIELWHAGVVVGGVALVIV